MSAEIVGIVGPMFSKKSAKLLMEIKGYEAVGVRTQMFKPDIDNRGEGLEIAKSRDGVAREATSIDIAVPEKLVASLNPETKLIGIDEVQFFSPGILQVVKYLTREMHISVHFSGLNTDFRGEPFGSVPELMSLSNRLDFTTARCSGNNGTGDVCMIPATLTQRLVNGEPADYNSPLILVGDSEEGYTARCYLHHEVPGRPKVRLSVSEPAGLRYPREEAS